MQVAHVLVRAEALLRARGLTGAAAFEQLLLGLQRRLGDVLPADAALDTLLHELDLTEEIDLLGLAYERFFSDLFKGRHGQFFTPRPLVSLLLSLLEIQPEERVLDPTCGTGGFLVCAARLGANVSGIELDPRLTQLATLNLRLAGLKGRVCQGDVFQSTPEPVDVVVANPPFSVPITDPQILEQYRLGQGRSRVLSDWLFVEALERWVRPGGRAGILLPWSVLNSPTSQPLRDHIDERWHRQVTVGLPEGVFRPFGGAAGRACMLVLQRADVASKSTRWACIDDPGYDVRSRYHRPTQSNEVARLQAGVGWQDLPQGAWTPAQIRSGRSVSEVATLRRMSVAAVDLQDSVDVLELADTNRRTGEAASRSVSKAQLKGRRQYLRAGDVLVSRMRPELGNVVIADRDCVGSPEWIALEVPKLPHWVLLALRTPSWRHALPITEGQTRPRTSADAVLASSICWPDAAVAESVDHTAEALYQRRRDLEVALAQLQAAVDLHASGAVSDEHLMAVRQGIDRRFGID